MVAGLTYTRAYFRMHAGSIKGEQIVEFLKALRIQFIRPMLIVWDGLKVHRSKVVRRYLDSLDGHIQTTFLPPYAPELNPVEYLWAWLKRHALANFCPDTLTQLAHTARSKLRSAQHRPNLIIACWQQAELF